MDKQIKNFYEYWKRIAAKFKNPTEVSSALHLSRIADALEKSHGYGGWVELSCEDRKAIKDLTIEIRRLNDRSQPKDGSN